MKVTIAHDQKTFLDHYIVRGEVFIVEQQIDWREELDDKDYHSDLFTLYIDEQPVGAARLFEDKVGRVAVLKAYRHRGLGRVLMNHVETHAKQKGIDTLYLGAQTYIVPFYESIGYKTYGDIFLDADIDHIMMKKQLK